MIEEKDEEILELMQENNRIQESKEQPLQNAQVDLFTINEETSSVQ